MSSKPKQKKQTLKWRFVQDDSCHWYCIPANQRELFEKWVDSADPGEGSREYDGPSFDEYRLGMYISNYTFDNLEED